MTPDDQSTRARDDARADAIAHSLERALGHALASARHFVLDLDHAGVRGPDAQARDRDRTRALDRARQIVRELGGGLDDAEIDASGADLSDLGPTDMDTLAGVLWDEHTTWPPDIAQQVRDRSTQIRPGLYRVTGGSEREDTDMITV